MKNQFGGGKFYIDVLKLLMDKESKVPVFTPDGDFISFDTQHTTKKGAEFLGNLLLGKTKLKEIFIKENRIHEVKQ